MTDYIQWRQIIMELPPEGKLVDTISPSGTQQQLKLQGKLWFLADGSMYVYYTPIFWREIA